MPKTTEKQARQALSEFSQRLAQSHVPELKVSESVKINLTVPALESIGTDFNQQLLRNASIQFSPKKGFSMSLVRNGEQVTLKLTKRF